MRTTLVFLLGVLTGIGAGIVTVLAGSGTTAAAVKYCHWLIT